MNPKDKLKENIALLAALNRGLTKEDFTKAYSAVVTYVKNMDVKLTQSFFSVQQAIMGRLEAGLQENKNRIDEYARKAEARIATLEKGKQGDDGYTPVKGKDYFDGTPGEPGKDADPNVVASIVLAELQANPIKAEDVEGLDDRLETHVRKYGERAGLTAIGVNRPQMTYYDLSARLDGNTVDFTMPSFQKIIQISLSSYPNILRPGIDFTESHSPTKITFIGQIAANKATILSAGQTAIILLLA